MSRPHYENEESLSNENIVKCAIEKRGFVLCKLPISYKIDFMAFKDNKPTSVIEVKCRMAGITSKTYACFMLSLAKWHAGIEYFIKSGLPFILVGKYEDGIFCYNYSPEDVVSIKWFNGRCDREDADDQEPCVYVPMKLFRRLPNEGEG